MLKKCQLMLINKKYVEQGIVKYKTYIYRLNNFTMKVDTHTHTHIYTEYITVENGM